ncbi:hypothetical protein SAXI111661_07980 [Saccharomonospora xinjiangensis]|uniref:hypothetical protein n=1 Tax=Saccharomonospora xinjiangensis TaxID=75294 RepID=UPI00106FA86F|nr:hypothetical protein [Saccharomonospora xinjiangensis]QBQ61555.1 hypothetical protein EYD13_16050 [Saccharomonospora xinjiangensis]
MSAGFRTEAEAFDAFGNQLDDLAATLREIGEMIGSCVADPGIFGVVGQVFGAGASMHCAEASGQFNEYADCVERLKDKLITAKRTYEEQDDAVRSTIARYTV